MQPLVAGFGKDRHRLIRLLLQVQNLQHGVLRLAGNLTPLLRDSFDTVRDRQYRGGLRAQAARLNNGVEGEQLQMVADRLRPLQMFTDQLTQVGESSECALDSLAVNLALAFEPFDTR